MDFERLSAIRAEVDVLWSCTEHLEFLIEVSRKLSDVESAK